MERTTVYLDAELKRRLKSAAARGQRSEAAMIREALEQYLATESVPTLRPVGNSTDGNSTDGNSTDGNSTDGNSTDGGIADRVDTELEEQGFGRTSESDSE